jgi:antitoxin component of MazEF toxin-antitoxin module
MVELKVCKFGNSLGVVLPKEVIHRLRTEDGEKLFLIEAAEGGYRLTPHDPREEDEEGRRHHGPLSQHTACPGKVRRKEPVWIEQRDVLAIHDQLLAAYGGLPGLRDEASAICSGSTPPASCLCPRF